MIAHKPCITYQGTTSQGAQLKDAELLLADVYHEFEAQPSLQMTDRGIIAGLGPRSIAFTCQVLDEQD